ncbi:hypothetical protein L6452_33760 [Arctium lappa]|uniref:Uncharacterized protein n=1 Tax=Arctium lappa TaxID=4217 RepID=A0ACB8YHH1_ARCLA|nr:hypothetical protein L6452_33760 [Arctium lappa]
MSSLVMGLSLRAWITVHVVVSSDDEPFPVLNFPRFKLTLVENKPVLYVSFGTMAEASLEQLREVAVGLEKSNVSFIWVLNLKQFELIGGATCDDVGNAVDGGATPDCSDGGRGDWDETAIMAMIARMVVEEIGMDCDYGHGRRWHMDVKLLHVIKLLKNTKSFFQLGISLFVTFNSDPFYFVARKWRKDNT